MRVKRFDLFIESKSKFPNIKTVDVDGYQVLIGKDSASNDHLSLNMANPDDMWFHVKGHPGSHVIVRCKDKSITPEVKKKVAELAAKNSKCGKGKCVVVCCKSIFVTKSSEMKPGQVKVDYINSEEIDVEN